MNSKGQKIKARGEDQQFFKGICIINAHEWEVKSILKIVPVENLKYM